MRILSHMPATAPMLTVPEAAERLDVHPATLRRWIADGNVAIITLPSGRRRVPAAEIDRILTAKAAS